MLKHVFTFCICCFAYSAFSQKVPLIKLDQLNKRLTAGKDTTYIINFWATWCAPCIKELPGFEKLNTQYKTEKLKVLLISVDFKSELNSSVIPFVKKKHLKKRSVPFR